MALMFMPGQFAKRAEFYYQLAQYTAAGVTLTAALDQLSRKPPARSYRVPAQALLGHLAQGETLTDALSRMGNWLPAFDIALLHAGEQSGRLDACFRLLSDYYQDRARIARQLIADLAYPVALFHFAVFLLPFSAFFLSGDWKRYLLQTLGVVLPIYALIALVTYAAQSRHGERWRAFMEALLHRVPVLGRARRSLALSRLAAALEALLSAGVTIVEAWELAANACGSPALRRTVLGWRPLVDAGQTPAEVVTASRRFPELFSSQYSSGEISGKLEENLKRLHQYYNEEGSRKLHALAQWTPRLVYLAIVLFIGYRVIHFWMGYFQEVQNAAGF